MNKAIIGKKLGMSQIYTAEGNVIPVTVIEAGPCSVVQVKTEEKDGFKAVQLGFAEKKEKDATKPEKGHFKKAGVKPQKVLKEFRLEGEYKAGEQIKCDVFKEGDVVDVSGISKGHGFAGNIKRWGQHRLKETHGTGPTVRSVGSMGANSSPSRVFPGKKMPGHYGVENVTVLNLTVVKVDVEKNALFIKGAVPGAKGGIVTVRNAIKN